MAMTGRVDGGSAVAEPDVRAAGPIVDFHAHLLCPPMYAETVAHTPFAASYAKLAEQEGSRQRAAERVARIEHNSTDVVERIAAMDAMGVDIQVLSSSLVHQNTHWAEPEHALRLDRMFNDHVASIVAAKPRRYVGLGSVPLHAPKLAAAETKRCVEQLGLAGVTVSSTARDLEIGDRALWAFWEAAEEIGAVVYIHPAGNTGARFEKYHLWNSVGQPFEEAMALTSLMYEGVLDAFPRLKICIAHGGGYLPFNLGRVTRNYYDKPHTRVNMTRTPAEYLRMLYYDTCLYEPHLLALLVERVGVDRVLLGSDYPIGEAQPVDFVRDAPGLSNADREKILCTNAAELLGLDVAVPA